MNGRKCKEIEGSLVLLISGSASLVSNLEKKSHVPASRRGFFDHAEFAAHFLQKFKMLWDAEGRLPILTCTKPPDRCTQQMRGPWYLSSQGPNRRMIRRINIHSLISGVFWQPRVPTTSKYSFLQITSDQSTCTSASLRCSSPREAFNAQRLLSSSNAQLWPCLLSSSGKRCDSK